MGNIMLIHLGIEVFISAFAINRIAFQLDLASLRIILSALRDVDRSQ